MLGGKNMSMYKKLTLEDIKELQEKNKEINIDLDRLKELEKKELELEASLRENKLNIKKINERYESFEGKNLTTERLMLYCPTFSDSEINMRVHKIVDKSLHLSGFYNYQYTLNIVIPDYEKFITDGYYKGSFTIYNSTHNYIVVNEYTNDIMKEIIFGFLKSELSDLQARKTSREKTINDYKEQIKELDKDIKTFEDVSDDKIQKLYDRLSFFPYDKKESFMNSLPRKTNLLNNEE